MTLSDKDLDNLEWALKFIQNQEKKKRNK